MIPDMMERRWRGLKIGLWGDMRRRLFRSEAIRSMMMDEIEEAGERACKKNCLKTGKDGRCRDGGVKKRCFVLP